MIFVLSPTEILGYVGGVVLAVALLPQVIHTCKTRSTRDISYGWQIIYIVGLILNFVYFVLVNATAAWVTLTLELFFAIALLLMKLKLDGCKQRLGKEPSEGEDEPSSITDQGSTNDDDPEQGLSRPRRTVRLDRAIPAVYSDDDLDSFEDCNYCYGSHIIVDAVPATSILTVGFGEMLMTEILRLADVHKVCIVHHHVESLNASHSEFSTTAVMGKGQITAHCCAGRLIFHFLHCGVQPNQTMKLARDVLIFLQKFMPSETQCIVHSAQTSFQVDTNKE